MNLRSWSGLVLLAANLVPLAGVLFYGWDAMLVMALFWIENLIIGGFYLLRIVVGGLYQKDSSGFFLAPFFCVHYGAFCAVHGQLLSELLGRPAVEAEMFFPWAGRGLQLLYLDGVAVLLSFIEQFSPVIWLGIAALFLSKLAGFIEDFLLGGGIYNKRLNKMMSEPYPQIFVMHAGLLFGAFLLQRLGSPMWLLVSLVVFKILIDFKGFRSGHVSDSELKNTL